MGEARNTQGREDKCIKRLQNLKGIDHLGAIGVGGKIILNWIVKKQLWIGSCGSG